MLVSLPAPISKILLPFFIQISTQTPSPQRLRMNHLIQDLIICGMGPGILIVCLLLSCPQQQNTWHTTAIQIFVLQSLPVRQEREPKSFSQGHRASQRADASYILGVLQSSRSEHCARRKQFSFSGLPSQNLQPCVLGGNALLLSYSEEMPVWALGWRKIRLDAHRSVQWLGSQGKLLGFFVVMVNLHCQVAQTQNYQGDVSLGLSMRLFPEKYNCGGKIHAKYGRHHPRDQRTSIHLSAS